MNPGIKAAHERLRKAERELESMIRETYRVGDVVHYLLGDHEIHAEVLDNNGYRLKVRGLCSGKEYWIGVYRLTESAGGDESPGEAA